MINRRIFKFCGWLTLFLLTGCSTTLEDFSNPAQPESAKATLEGYWRYLFLYDEALGIASVDGRRATNIFGYWQSVKLSPGRHWIGFRINRYSTDTVARCAFEFEFQAQHHYKINALNYEGLLAHPLSSPYNASILMQITERDHPVQKLNIATVCTNGDDLCRQNSDCGPNRSCQKDKKFNFGVCKLN